MLTVRATVVRYAGLEKTSWKFFRVNVRTS